MRYWIDVERGLEKQHGSNLDTSDLYLTMRHFYLTDERIVVTRVVPGDPEGSRATTDTRRGRVGMTTGWKPAFILMHKANDIGSSDVLSMWDVAVGLVHTPNRSPSVLVACGSGHYGTTKSECTKYLGHPGIHNKGDMK